MINIMEVLDNNNKVVIDVYNKEDLFALTGVEFSVYDYIKEDGYIKLYQANGSELILPINEIMLDEENESWYCVIGDIEVNISIDEKN